MSTSRERHRTTTQEQQKVMDWWEQIVLTNDNLPAAELAEMETWEAVHHGRPGGSFWPGYARYIDIDTYWPWPGRPKPWSTEPPGRTLRYPLRLDITHLVGGGEWRYQVEALLDAAAKLWVEHHNLTLAYPEWQWGSECNFFIHVAEQAHGAAVKATLPSPTLRAQPAAGRTKVVIPVNLRWLVWERDDFTCQAPGCGSRRDLSVDHILAESKGGTLDLENLQTLCRPCNSRKGNR